MKFWKMPFLIAFTVFVFWFIKFNFIVAVTDIEIVGIVLTITSILFGFLAGFFISELWSRYTEIRSLQGDRSSSILNMIKYAEYFYKNKKFKKEFNKLVERCIIVDEIVEWSEGHIEIPYHREIADSFNLIEDKEVKSVKDDNYFDNLLDSYHDVIKTTVRLDSLGKERLFPSEWFLLFMLSTIIAFSVLFLDITHPLYKILILTFPAIIVLALTIIYDLNTLSWSKEIISLEPIQRIFDAIGVKRFYLSKKKKYISKRITGYRTEKNLKGEYKKLYNEIKGLQKKYR